MKSKIKIICLFIVFLFLSATSVAAGEIENLDALKKIALPMHFLELVLSLFICFMALKFFRITRPINLFLVVYVALGFFIVNSLLYILLYFWQRALNISFINVYIGSRIALIGMLISFVTLFYQWNKVMRKKAQ